MGRWRGGTMASEMDNVTLYTVQPRVMSISHITDKLILSSSPSLWTVSQFSPDTSSVNPSKDVLRSLFQTLSPPLSPTCVRDTIKHLQKLEDENKQAGAYASRSIDTEEQALKNAVLGRLVAGIYAEALDTLLAEAISAEVEAEWWADLERSRLRVAYYLLQSTSKSTRRSVASYLADYAFSVAPPHFQYLPR